MSFVPLDTIINRNRDKQNKTPDKPQVVTATSSLPSFLVHGPFTSHGYRFGHNFASAAKSLFTIHNDTMSVWSHLVPIPVFAWLGIECWETKFHTMNTMQALGYWMFVYAVVQCLALSTGYHLFRCVSLETSDRLLALDVLGFQPTLIRNFFLVFVTCTLFELLRMLLVFQTRKRAGILVLVSFSFLAPLQLAFQCSPGVANAYCAGILAMAVVGSVGVLRNIDGPLLVLIPVLMVATAVVPLTHYHILHAHDPLIFALDLKLASSIAAYALGLLFKNLYLPERLFPPGVCDLGLSSHVVWHLLVLVGVQRHFAFVDGLHTFTASLHC
eukprot:c7876_g1_i2.p1 GENE.c7876_g1_i2~~c7876_g1_i2.p1  ORF type:complete len:341 (+),score=77.68 c7876_g1_i2:40-1023(+)